jgi:hypothetical protein
VQDLHAWNIVDIDGVYCQIDTTWGDPVGVAVPEKNFNYFGLTDLQMYRDHFPDEMNYPLCVNDRFDYFKYEGKYLEAYDRELLKQMILESDRTGEEMVFKMANAQVFNDVKYRLVTQKEMFDLFRETNGFNGTYYHNYNDITLTAKITWR